MDNSSVLDGSKVTCCVGRPTATRPQSDNNFCAVDTFLYFCESSWFDNLGIFTEGNLLLRYISPSTWGNQREVRELSSSPYQANFWRHCRGFQGTTSRLVPSTP